MTGIVSRGILIAVCTVAGTAGCGGGAGGPGVGGWAGSLLSPPCREAGPVGVLPTAAQESSGVVVAGGGAEPPSYWTHNDSGWPAEILRIGTDGALMDRVRVSGARNIDWEDMAAGPCPGGEGAGAGHRCLYLADTGDNAERRASMDIYRVREPAPGATLSDPAHRLRFRIPEGPRDIEAMVLLEHENFLFVTKGRNHAVGVFLLDAAGGGSAAWTDPGAIEADGAIEVATGEVLEARRVQSLTSGAPGWRGLVTGAAAAPLASGGWIVAIRTYQSLRFYRVEPFPETGVVAETRVPSPEAELLVPIPGAAISLLPLREAQGEAVAFAGGGSLVLTSEGGLAGGPASIRTLDCSAGFARWGVAPLLR